MTNPCFCTGPDHTGKCRCQRKEKYIPPEEWLHDTEVNIRKAFIIPEPVYEWSVTIASHTFVTLKGHEPNAFHRWMQEKLLGFKWRKYDD